MPNAENHHDLTFKGVILGSFWDHGHWLFEIKTFHERQLIDAHSENINIYAFLWIDLYNCETHTSQSGHVHW